MPHEEYVPPVNPFVADEDLRTKVLLTFTENFKIGCLTVGTSIEGTQNYAQLVALSVGHKFGDLTQGIYALLFETAVFLDVNTGDQGVELGESCNHATGEECRGNCAEQAAFLDAAARGDFPAVINVIKAVFKRGVQDPDDDGDLAISRLYAGVLGTIVGNAQMDSGVDPSQN